VLFHTEEEREALQRWLEPRAAKPVPATVEAPAAPVDLERAIHECGLCEGTLGKKPGFGTGASGVMVVLNAPRLITAEEKRLLKGGSIDLMKKMLAAIGLGPGECYITNIIKCEPDVTAKPSAMFRNCEPFMEREIAEMRPHTVIVMGQIIPLKKEMDARKGIRWFNTDHPVTLIKNPDLKKSAWNTLKLVRAHLDEIQESGPS
jgi:DNA polymerase